MKRSRFHNFLQITFLALIAGCTITFAAEAGDLSVTVDKAKPGRGESVSITVTTKGGNSPRLMLLQPSSETIELRAEKITPTTFRSIFRVAADAPDGLYGIHAFLGERDNPKTAAKASFRVGNIVADFLITNYIDKQKPGEDLDKYLADFRSVGGNFLIAHNIIIAAGAFYPSKIAATEVKSRGASNDLVEMILDRADKLGFPVLLSVSWDVTKNTPYSGRMNEIKAIIAELHAMYSRHPSLVGFYSWQEGSGTYYAPFVREFSAYVKTFDRGLLTACAPHIDDPLLAGYLSVIDDLDMMIYQSAVMASWRPDNRKKYPPRRVRDFSALGTGAKRLQNKIALTHVELFAYMEKIQSKDFLTAPPSDISDQILSAAAVTDSDGIALFAYHAHIYEPLKKNPPVQASKKAVSDALAAFKTITAHVTDAKNPFALYIPYSDFIVERWSNYFLPALDAFRRLGIPMDILPYAPKHEESVYPYYPIHHNPDVLERLLKEKTILVLANVSGFQQTDSDMLKEFVARGGTIIALGELIPMGRTFDREELFGGKENKAKPHRQIKIINTAGNGPNRKAINFTSAILPSWSAETARVVAAFEDGSAAVLANSFGKGTVITIVTDAPFAALRFPDVVRDVFVLAVNSSNQSLAANIIGADEQIETAVKTTADGFNVTVINHHPELYSVFLRPANSNFTCKFINNIRTKGAGERFKSSSIKIEPHNYSLIECITNKSAS